MKAFDVWNVLLLIPNCYRIHTSVYYKGLVGTEVFAVMCNVYASHWYISPHTRTSRNLSCNVHRRETIIFLQNCLQWSNKHDYMPLTHKKGIGVNILKDIESGFSGMERLQSCNKASKIFEASEIFVQRSIFVFIFGSLSDAEESSKLRRF